MEGADDGFESPRAVGDPALASLHELALTEAGKALLSSSIDVGRDFCKSLITIAFGAIPIYLALVGLAVGSDYRPDPHQGLVLVLAPGAWILAAIAFAIGYFPKSVTFSMDCPAQIDNARTSILKRRVHCARIGFGLFVLGIALGVAGVFYALSLR